MNSLKNVSLFTVIFLFAISCSDKDNPKSTTGKLVIAFEHYVDGEPLVFDEMKYTNAAGNEYEVTEIQYFVSDITLNNENGAEVLISKDHFAHYVDTNIPETKIWDVVDEIPAGTYKSISMTFGIKGEKNEPFMFTDPPESDMLWPTNLGGDHGGYHYMKLNGFWKNLADEREPFNFHLGVGQERDAENNIIGFIQNWIEVEIPNSAFTIESGDHKGINLRMNVDQWWENPNTYDHNIHGGKIMQNQEAMRMGVENGKSVFSVSGISEVVQAL